MEQQQETQLLSIIFELDNNLFSVDSSRISSIMRLPDTRPVPNTPPAIRGVARHMSSSIAILDLRVALGMEPLERRYHEFCAMIDSRKQDHINWVSALERTVHEGAAFRLATDHHKCALGQWRDQFESDVQEVNFQLRRLDGPHARLHHCAQDILQRQRRPGTEQEQIDIYQHAKTEYMPMVLSLLDNTKNVFRMSVFREMLLVLAGRRVGVAVDKVLAVEPITPIEDSRKFNTYLSFPCITSVYQSAKLPGLIWGLDLDRLLAYMDDYEVQLDGTSDTP